MGGRRTQVTTRRGLQLVALAMAALLLVYAVVLVTVGRETPWYRCPPLLEPPLSWVMAGIYGAIGIGFGVSALRDLRGPDLKDPLLVGMFLTFGSTMLLFNAARGFATGIVYLGRRGCVEVGPPISYPLSAIGLLFGTAIMVAAMIVLFESSSDD